MDDVAAVHELLAGKASVKVWTATFVGFDGTSALVDISNGDRAGRVPASVTTSFIPQVRDAVTVVSVDGQFYLIGPSAPKPAKGTVTAVASDVVTVSTDFGDVAATYDAGTSLSTSQVVKLFWSDGPHVVGILTAPPAPIDPPPDPDPPSKQTHTDVFTAVDTGSFSGGRWWQPQPWASDNTLGAWFYGSKVRDTLQGADVSKIEIWVSLASKFGNAPNFGTHPHGSKPAGAPSISNATPLAVAPGGMWLTLPTSFGQFLSSNVGGIGLAHGGFNKFNTLAADAQSGALRITSTY